MKHTDNELQAAIDAAMIEIGKQVSGPAFAACPKAFSFDWPAEATARLALAKAFLAELGKIKQETPEEAKAANLKAYKEFQDEIHATWENADAQPWQPAPGDVVRLKSGGPEMTVDTLVEAVNGETVYGCFWIGSDGQPYGYKLPSIMLEPANKKHD